MKPYIFETERMYAREMKVQDFNALFHLFQDPEVMKYYPGVKSEEETRQWITWTISNYRRFETGLWVLEDKSTHSFIGQCGLVPRKIDGEVMIEIGYMLAREHWGKGLATEAAEACKSYGSSHFKFSHIVSLVDAENIPSIRVSEKLAMTFQKNIIRFDKLLRLYQVQL